MIFASQINAVFLIGRISSRKPYFPAGCYFIFELFKQGYLS